MAEDYEEGLIHGRRRRESKDRDLSPLAEAQRANPNCLGTLEWTLWAEGFWDGFFRRPRMKGDTNGQTA